MTDLFDTPPDPEPLTEPAPTEPVGPTRTLTPAEYDTYAGILDALGFVLEAQGEGDEAVGFRVTGNGDTYDYRYGEGESASGLMDRIVAQLGG